MSELTRVGIRVSLASILLLIVWLHAHWSVALCLTLLALRSEAHDYVEYMKRKIG